MLEIAIAIIVFAGSVVAAFFGGRRQERRGQADRAEKAYNERMERINEAGNDVDSLSGDDLNERLRNATKR